MLRADPVGPRITYYDDATGERIELSAVTLANWAAKTGNLLRDELGAGPASRVAVLLPAHWQTAAVLFGVWWIGADVVLGDGSEADIALCTVDRLDERRRHRRRRGGGAVVGPVRPPGTRSAGRCHRLRDRGAGARRPDRRRASSRPGVGRPISRRGAGRLPKSQLAQRSLTASDRVLSTASWDRPDDLIAGLLAVLAIGGSLVQVANPDPAALPRRIETEKVTRTLD